MKNLLKKVICGISLLLLSSAFAKADDKQVAMGMNQFAFDLYPKIALQNENVVFSPYSLASLFAILLNGAEGKTLEEMQSLLHLSTLSLEAINTNFISLGEQFKKISSCENFFRCERDRKTALLTANGIWSDSGLSYEKDFLILTKQNKTVDFYQTDFETQPERATQKINAWIEQKTQNRIHQLLPEGAIKADTKMVLVNAIYFKGKWAKTFNADNTTLDTFHLLKGKSKEVAMMNQTDDFSYGETKTMQILQLPYLNSTLAMAILLPKANHSISEFLKSLSAEKFFTLLESTNKQKVNVILPKFDIASTFDDLIDPIEALGLKAAFSKQANFLRMASTPLIISDIIQKAMIKVDEEGTVAAAATSVGLEVTAFHPPVIFKADHPFLFFIFDTNTKVILFIGQVTKP